MATNPLIRICLDLNVWVADFLGTRRGRRGGSGPWLADAVRSAVCPAGSLQLVVSLGMLERLAMVFVRMGLDSETAEVATRAIGTIASLGPAGDYSYVVLGGGVYPIRDTEDRHVLEVAVAGEADVIATANLADFDMEGIEKVADGSRVRIYNPPGRAPLIIAHPDQVRAWLRSGVMPTAEVARQSPDE
jgi:predicted nucleic acid-binding protein